MIEGKAAKIRDHVMGNVITTRGYAPENVMGAILRAIGFEKTTGSCVGM